MGAAPRSAASGGLIVTSDLSGLPTCCLPQPWPKHLPATGQHGAALIYLPAAQLPPDCELQGISQQNSQCTTAPARGLTARLSMHTGAARPMDEQPQAQRTWLSSSTTQFRLGQWLPGCTYVGARPERGKSVKQCLCCRYATFNVYFTGTDQPMQ